MSSRILIVGYSDLNLAAAREDWKGYNVQLDAVNTAAEAIIQFSRRQYIAVIASYDLPDIAPLFELISETNRIPLVALSQRESGIKFAGSIINGANKFILDPNKLIESIKENKGLIDGITRMPPHERKSLGVLAHREIVMLIEFRKVYVHGKEIALTTCEFEILQTLFSQIGWVFTYEQLYTSAYGEYAPAELTINSIRCHIYRIRQRLRLGADQSYIDSVRSVGYRIAV